MAKTGKRLGHQDRAAWRTRRQAGNSHMQEHRQQRTGRRSDNEAEHSLISR